MDFDIINDNLKNKKYNEVINYIYKNYNGLTRLIKLNNNPQTYDSIDLFQEIKKLKGVQNSVRAIEVLKRLVNYIVRKLVRVQLDGNNEFAYKNNSEFFVNIADDKNKLRSMLLQLILFHYEAMHVYKNDKSQSYFIGVDYEFNSQKIAMCQICLFPRNKTKYIWVFDPRELTENQKKVIIKYLFTSRYIYKIFHGGDSLDIPYVLTDFFNRDKEYANKFIEKVIDTRFICEFQKIVTQEENKKCSIYDALYFVGTITKNKYEDLNKHAKHINYSRKWDVHSIDKKYFTYAYYDVLFLREFLFDSLRYSKKMTPDKYKNIELIPEITRFVYLEKSQIYTLLPEIKIKVDQWNNQIVNEKKLIDSYNDIINKPIESYKLKLLELLNINYFKSSLTLLFKYVIYSHYLNHSIKKVTDHLENIKMNKLLKLLRELNKYIE